MWDRLFTAGNIAKLLGLAFVEYLPTGVGVAALMAASPLNQLGLHLVGWGVVLLALSIYGLALMLRVRAAYGAWTVSLFGDIERPDARQQRAANRRWFFLIWPVVFAATVGPVFGLIFFLPTSTIAAGCLVMIAAMPMTMVASRLGDLATLWVHVRTQGRRSD